MLEHGREFRSNYVELEKWYDLPIKTGHYQLTIKRRFTGDGDWVESNPVTFDVVSAQPNEQLAQQQQNDLDQTRDKMTRHMESQMSGWQHRHGSVMEPSKGVVIEIWTFPNRIVKVSMMQRESVEAARENLAHFAREEPEARELKGFGDEAYSWGDDDSNIVFRRGKYTVYVATTADVERDADASSLTREQKRDRRKSEMKRLSREIAKHAADGID